MNIHELVEVPDDANFFVVGDIHGCNKMLMDALALAGYDEKRDYVFCVGDLIDRGPENLEVLAKFLYNPRFRSVRGNHDQFMISGDYANWAYNGGMWAFEKLDTDTIKELAVKMEEKLPVFMTIKHRGVSYGLVHAGIPFKYPHSGIQAVTPDWPEIITTMELEEDPELYVEPYLWDRDVIQEIGFNLWRSGKTKGDKYFQRYANFRDEVTTEIPEVHGVKYVFHGHTGVPFPLKYGNRVYLDTGGVFNHRLTVAQVYQDQIHCYTTEEHDPCGTVEIIK